MLDQFGKWILFPAVEAGGTEEPNGFFALSSTE